MQRMWINQPSTHQPLHNLHGTNVLATPEGHRIYRAYFLSGPIHSMQVPLAALSPGWKDND